jgi:uridine kinase/pyruvate-formate lyase-activating enzyme
MGAHQPLAGKMHPDDFLGDMKLLAKRIATRASYLPPSRVTVHLTNRCNHKCHWCWFSRDHQELELDATLKTLDSLISAGAEEVIISGGGEPLMYSRRKEIFDFLAKHGSIRNKLYTHGGLLRRNMDAVAGAFDYIRISLDAGDADTYAGLHGVREDEFEHILCSARELAASGVAMGASMVVTNANRESIPLLIERCAEAGIRYVLLKPIMIGMERIAVSIAMSDISGSGPDVLIGEATVSRRTTVLPATAATMAVTLVPEGVVLPCCHLMSSQWSIAAVGSVLDDRFERQHKEVSYRYACVPHSCRAHDVWQRIRCLNAEEGNVVISALDYLRTSIGFSLETSAMRVAEYAADRQLNLIGITGPSSVGKSTFAKTVAREMRQLGRRATVIQADDFLVPEMRGNHSYRNSGTAPLQPEYFNYGHITELIDRLRRGEKVTSWTYERGVGWDQYEWPSAEADCYVVEGLFLDSVAASIGLAMDLIIVLEASWNSIADMRRRRDGMLRKTSASGFRTASETEEEIERTRAAYLAYERDTDANSCFVVTFDDGFTVREVDQK